MKNIFLIILGLLIGSGITLFTTKTNKELVQILNTPFEETGRESTDDEDIEAKIEQINELPSSPRVEIDGKVEELFGECDPETEIQAIQERYLCNKKTLKAKKYWTNMKEAQKAVFSLLKAKKIKELMEYASCESYDLTWYEMLCETDRLKIQAAHFQNLIHFTETLTAFSWNETEWIQKRPDRRKFRNPRWILRSRLKSENFRLLNPWSHTAHPTEHGTVLLLEQKLDGKIYIVGIPVTGTIKE